MIRPGRGYYTQDITISQTTLVLLPAGLRDISVSVPGLAVGSACFVTTPSGPPAGYATHNAWCAVAGTLMVRCTCLVLVASGTFSIPAKLAVLE